MLIGALRQHSQNAFKEALAALVGPGLGTKALEKAGLQWGGGLRRRSYRVCFLSSHIGAPACGDQRTCSDAII